MKLMILVRHFAPYVWIVAAILWFPGDRMRALVCLLLYYASAIYDRIERNAETGGEKP